MNFSEYIVNNEKCELIIMIINNKYIFFENNSIQKI